MTVRLGISALLLAILAVASACDSRRPPPRRVPPPPAPPPVAPVSSGGPTIADTGALAFPCQSASHGEREAVFETCPGCGKKDYFAPGGDGYFCFACKQPLSIANIKCDMCGAPPAKMRQVKLKHR